MPVRQSPQRLGDGGSRDATTHLQVRAPGGAWSHCDAELSPSDSGRCSATGSVSCSVARAIDRREDPSRVIEEGVARGQELHPARGSREEPRADLVFERADLAAHRGLRDMEPLRRAAHVALVGDGNEVADLGKAHRSIVHRARPRCKRCAGTRDRNGIGRARAILASFVAMAIEILSGVEM